MVRIAILNGYLKTKKPLMRFVTFAPNFSRIVLMETIRQISCPCVKIVHSLFMISPPAVAFISF